ncbi:MAG TPA: DUF6587 family protein [Telluria sp.]
MQELAVALIVVAAFGYVGLKYMPKATRRKLSARLEAHPRVARWFGQSAGCGSGCDTCGTCDEPAKPADQPSRPGARVITIHPRD